MIEFAFWFLYIAIPVIIVYLMKLAGERVNHISIINIVVLSIYIFSIIGTMPLYYQIDEYREDIGVKDQSIIFEILLYSSLNIIFLLVGVIFVRVGGRLKPEGAHLVNQKLSNKQLLCLFIIFMLSVVITILYISQLDGLALFIALSSGAKDAAVSRSQMGNDFPGKYHWYSLFMNDMMQFITYVLFANCLVDNKKTGIFFFSIALSCTIFTAIMATEKGPLIWLLIGLLLVYLMVKRNGFIPLAEVLKFSLILMGVLIIMYVFFMGSKDIFSALNSILSRTFTGQITPTYFYLEYFPDVQNYLWGRTFPNPGGMLPFTPYRYTVEIMNWVFPNLENINVVGSMPTVFWGESYINFGPVGIPIIAFLIGIMLKVFSLSINLLKWSPLRIGFLVWACLHYKDLSGTGFSGFLIDIYLFVIFILTYIINGFRGNIKK